MGSSAGLATRWSWVRILLVPLCFGTLAIPHNAGEFRRSNQMSLLSGVHARGSKRSHTGSKCVTCLREVKDNTEKTLLNLRNGIVRRR